MNNPTKFSTMFTIKMGEDKFDCKIDSQGKKMIGLKDQNFSSLVALIDAHPGFAQDCHLGKLAMISNFMMAGLDYDCIDDVDEFKKEYEELQQDRIENPFNAFTFYEMYNLSSMQIPSIQEGKFVFYVKDKNNVPYCVTSQYPFGDPLSSSYELLPYVED